MSETFIYTIELPPEIWSKIILLAKPSYKQLIQLSVVSQTFRRLILNEWFLKKCFSRYPKLEQDLILHIDFTNVTKTLINPLINSVHGTIGLHDALSENNEDISIENNELFDRVLILNAVEPTWLFNVFTLNKVVSNSFSILLWFLCSSEGKLVLHFSHRYSWWCIQIEIDVEKQMKIKIFYGTKTWTVDAGKRDKDIWQHLAITRFKASLNFYVNGQKIKKIELDKSTNTQFDTFRIASYFSNGSALADIAVWSRRLLPEIKSIYQQKTSIRQADFIGGLLSGL
ncbi:hypothetical protein I4U23_015798 [Adineta vaga]|nr:hypothetical protein I4U23_015798 [Adineta vaga]